jgi:hypothetical protein
MKLTLPLCLFLLVFVCSARAPEIARATEGYPSAVSPNVRGLYAGDALIIERSDFRLMFCDVETLTDRISKSLCVVDGRSKAGVRGHLVAVHRGTTLREVLAEIHFPWPENHQQIRVVKRNEIRQSERSDSIDPKPFDPEEFLNQCHFAGENQPRSCGSKPATPRCLSSYQFWFSDQALLFRRKRATSRAETS